MAKKFNKKTQQVEEIADESQEASNVEATEEAAPQVEAAVTEELVDFESWHALRKAAIPDQHHKEILKADFNGRKVPEMASMADFDEALKKYGVKLA